eukprot:g4673.t1
MSSKKKVAVFGAVALIAAGVTFFALSVAWNWKSSSHNKKKVKHKNGKAREMQKTSQIVLDALKKHLVDVFHLLNDAEEQHASCPDIPPRPKARKSPRSGSTSKLADSPFKDRFIQFFNLVPQPNSLFEETVDGNISLLGLKPGKSFLDFENAVEKFKKEDPNSEIKVLYFIRHGEGEHNVAEKLYGSEHWEAVEAKKEKYFDPQLNDTGVQQASKLGSLLEKSNFLRIDAIVVSPLTRALETARIGLSKWWGKVPTFSVEIARETVGKNYCDKRRSLTELKNEYPCVCFDLMEGVEEDPWWTPERETIHHVELRVKGLLHFLALATRGDSMTVEDEEESSLDLERLKGAERIAIVGHSGFMTAAMKILGHWSLHAANCEMIPVIVKYNQSNITAAAPVGGALNAPFSKSLVNMLEKRRKKIDEKEDD